MVKKSLCQNKGTKTNLTQDNPGLPGLPLTQDYRNRTLNNWTQVHGSFVACVLYGNTETKMVDFTPGHKIERSSQAWYKEKKLRPLFIIFAQCS